MEKIDNSSLISHNAKNEKKESLDRELIDYLNSAVQSSESYSKVYSYVIEGNKDDSIPPFLKYRPDLVEKFGMKSKDGRNGYKSSLKASHDLIKYLVNEAEGKIRLGEKVDKEEVKLEGKRDTNEEKDRKERELIDYLNKARQSSEEKNRVYDVVIGGRTGEGFPEYLEARPELKEKFKVGKGEEYKYHTTAEAAHDLVEFLANESEGYLGPEEEEIINDDEFKKFKDSGEISDDNIEKIAKKIVKGGKLNERERDIYIAKSQKFSAILKKFKGEKVEEVVEKESGMEKSETDVSKENNELSISVDEFKTLLADYYNGGKDDVLNLNVFPGNEGFRVELTYRDGMLSGNKEVSATLKNMGGEVVFTDINIKSRFNIGSSSAKEALEDFPSSLKESLESKSGKKVEQMSIEGDKLVVKYVEEAISGEKGEKNGIGSRLLKFFGFGKRSKEVITKKFIPVLKRTGSKVSTGVKDILEKNDEAFTILGLQGYEDMDEGESSDATEIDSKEVELNEEIKDKITGEDLKEAFDTFKKEAKYGELEALAGRVPPEELPGSKVIEKIGLKEGDRVVFYSEKERFGIIEKNKNGEYQIVDLVSNPWGIVGILSRDGGYIKKYSFQYKFFHSLSPPFLRTAF